MQLETVAQTTFSMAAQPAQLGLSMFQYEERIIGRDISMEGLMLPGTTMSLVEEAAALETLAELAEMPANWDGYHALKINSGTVDNTKEALSRLLRYAPGPEITPNPNGTISFEWASGAGIAHLEIGMTRFGFFVKPTGGVPVAFEGLAAEVPAALGRIIAAYVFPPVRSVAAITKNLIYTAGHERSAA